jgi:hypothetical protein
MESPIAIGEGPAMSYSRKGILSVAAIAVTFGAAQFAFGEDLTVGMRTAGIPEPSIDRGAKANRAPIFAEPVAPTQTISIQVDRVPETSVLVRIPRAQVSPPGRGDEGTQGSAPQGNAGPQQIKEQRKATVACEPVVSVLTEIAKSLQPGRCIT